MLFLLFHFTQGVIFIYLKTFIFINFTGWQCQYFCCFFVNIIINCHDWLDILSERFSLKRKGLSDARVQSITKKKMVLLRIYKTFNVNNWRMIKCNLLKFSFVWNFQNEVMCMILSNIFCNGKIRFCNKNKGLVFFPL